MKKTSSSSGPLVMTGGTVLNPGGQPDYPRVEDIRIESGRIAAIGPPGSLGSPEVVQTIDARGMLVTPGFINAHYHSHDVLLRGMFEQMPLECWVLGSSPANYTRRSAEEVRVRTLLGAAENLRCGVTTIQDMVTIVGADREHVDTVLSAYEEAGIRVLLALQMADRPVAETVPFWKEELSSRALSQLGRVADLAPMQRLIAEILTGEQRSRSDRIAWALGPSAPQRCSENLLQWIARTAEQHNLRVFTHVYEARSQAVLARLAYGNDAQSFISFLDRLGLLNERLSIAHGVWIADDEIAMVARAGASVILNSISNLKLLNGIAPIRLYADAGVGLALGCDNCSGNDSQNIFESMKAFALWWAFQSKMGEEGAARRAFDAATLGGANALGLQEEVGAIRPGLRADLVLLNLEDPSFVPLNDAVRQLVYAATPRAVRMVLVDGETVFSQEQFSRFDEKSVHEAARQIHGEISDQFRAINTRTAILKNEILKINRKTSRYPLAIDRLRLS